jgi:universal stress protein E
MYPINRILIAVKDVHAKKCPAVAKGGQLAKALGAKVCLFHAISEPVYMEVENLENQTLSELEQRRSTIYQVQLERMARRLRRHGITVTTAVEWDFPTYEAVVRGASKFRADLIVAECYRATHSAPWFMHFTDWELLRRSEKPVLLIKNARTYRRSPVLAAIDPDHACSKPANLDDEIVRYARTVASALRKPLHAVHAYNPLLLGMTPEDLCKPRAIHDAQKKAAKKARAAVELLLNRMEMPQSRRHVIDGFTVDVIQHIAERIEPQILVMGAVSRSGLRRLLIGNTAEQILDRTTCDVLIVKPSQFTSRMARAPRGARVVAAPLISAGLAGL